MEKEQNKLIAEAMASPFFGARQCTFIYVIGKKNELLKIQAQLRDGFQDCMILYNKFIEKIIGRKISRYEGAYVDNGEACWEDAWGRKRTDGNIPIILFFPQEKQLLELPVFLYGNNAKRVAEDFMCRVFLTDPTNN